MKQVVVPALLLTSIACVSCGMARPGDRAVTAISRADTTTPVVREWPAGPVLARLGSGDCLDSCVGHVFSALPEITLYWDGRLVVFDGQTVREGRLADDALCRLLDAIDRAGFFDTNADAYTRIDEQFPRMAAMTWLEVNAWRSQRLYLRGLKDYLPGGRLAQKASIPPALIDTYRLLDDLKSAQPLRDYAPESLAVWIQEIGPGLTPPVGSEDGGAWTSRIVSLRALLARGRPFSSNAGARILVSGDEAHELYDRFGRSAQADMRVYTEDERRYVVAIRPLLPFEASGGEVGQAAQIPAAGALDAHRTMTCAISLNHTHVR